MINFSGVSEKRCKDCGEIKSSADFWHLKKSPDGLALYCKPCFKLRNAEAVRRRAEREGRSVRRFVPRQAVSDGVKRCPDCGETKALEDFTRNRAASSGHAPYCKPCQNARTYESRQRLHGGSRHYHLRRRYGLGADRVDAMVTAQHGVCVICLAPDPQHVDHDHKTGRVRAVLCFNCNGGLGQFKDRPDVLRRAADYLEGNLWKPTRLAPGVYRLPS